MAIIPIHNPIIIHPMNTGIMGIVGLVGFNPMMYGIIWDYVWDLFLGLFHGIMYGNHVRA